MNPQTPKWGLKDKDYIYFLIFKLAYFQIGTLTFLSFRFNFQIYTFVP